MKLDIEKLKALAEVATPGKWSTSGSYIAPTREESGTTYVESWRSIALVSHDADRNFIAAANPAAVLELIGKVESLREVLAATRDARDAKTCRVDELKSENEDGLAVIRTLKEQLNCYMKDAERYRYLRAGAATVANSRREFIVIEDIEAIPGDFTSGAEMLDSAIDAAMAQEQN